jgi:hypothetical protein
MRVDEVGSSFALAQSPLTTSLPQKCRTWAGYMGDIGLPQSAAKVVPEARRATVFGTEPAWRRNGTNRLDDPVAGD